MFVPIPVCLRSFRLSPSSARKMTPRHVPWPSLRLNKRYGVACSSFTAFACAHHEWCHSDRQVECRHAYPLGPFNNASPKILVIVNVVLELCNTATPVFLGDRSCVTGFPHQLEWETSHTVADRTSTILVSRAPDTTSMCGHSENQPRNRDQSYVHELTIFLHGFRYTAVGLVTMALRFGHKSSGSSSFRGVSTVLVFTVSRASKR